MEYHLSFCCKSTVRNDISLSLIWSAKIGIYLKFRKHENEIIIKSA